LDCMPFIRKMIFEKGNSLCYNKKALFAELIH